jgi:hypothetical protein|tara:strand:- start:3316 stop:3504 length:189 start_codon:yes stop_codon:yes gene_type:complete
MTKNNNNHLAKVVGKNEDNKNIVTIFRMKIEDNKLEYEELKEVGELDWDIARKSFSIVGVIQ